MEIACFSNERLLSFLGQDQEDEPKKGEHDVRKTN
jgi:hypothetical protein